MHDYFVKNSIFEYFQSIVVLIFICDVVVLS